ncbi:MAG: TylF/MycF/NovP-related O-methyltransferase [Patescibacteria group bacterium]
MRYIYTTSMKRRIRIFLNRLLKPWGYKLESIAVNSFRTKSAARLAKFQLFEQFFERIVKIDGDIVECGVGGGGSFFLLCYLVSVEKDRNRRLWGYDSFAGFPEPSVEDMSFRMPQKGDWGDISFAFVSEFFSNSDLPRGFVEKRVTIVPGFFSETLPLFPKRPIALLHIDADLYQSYRDAFIHLLPYLCLGGIIVFDEYANPKFPGATKAVDELIAQYGKKLVVDRQSGKYYIVW